MEEIKIIAQEYAALVEKYGYLQIHKDLPGDWKTSLTVDNMEALCRDAEWLAGIAQQFADKLRELQNALEPSFHANENEVLTIEEYMAQGFTREEAEDMKIYDTLWNKWVNSQATAYEIELMHYYQKKLDL